MMFTEDHAKKHKARADRLLAEAKHIAADYQDKVDQTLLQQDAQM